MSRFFEILVNLLLLALLGAIVVGAFSGKPACSKEGEILKFSHYLPIYNGTMMNLVPQFKCEAP